MVLDILIKSDGFIIKPTPYIKDPSKIRKGKLVILSVFQKEEERGLNIGNFSSGMAKCFKGFDALEKAIKDIKRFYIHTGEEDVNFQIENTYRGLKVYFIVSRENLSSEETFVKEIDELMVDLKKIYLEVWKKRGKLVGNSFDIRYKTQNEWVTDGNYWTKVLRGDYDNDLVVSSKVKSLRDWRDKVIEKGFEIVRFGGDNQLVIKLKKV